jgi:hypothetical protein
VEKKEFRSLRRKKVNGSRRESQRDSSLAGFYGTYLRNVGKKVFVRSFVRSFIRSNDGVYLSVVRGDFFLKSINDVTSVSETY